MDKWIKENKIIIAIISASIILGSFIYISQITKQKSIEKQQANTLIQEQEERCQKLAKQRNADIKKDNPDSSFFKFEYHYNSNTKMCILALVLTSWYTENTSLSLGRDYVITDLFTNKEIYSKRGLEPGDEAINDLNNWKHIADLYFYQKEIRTP